MILKVLAIVGATLQKPTRPLRSLTFHAINNLALLEINDEVLDPLFNSLVASGSDFLSTLIVDIAFHCQGTNAISLLQIQPKIRHSDTFNLAVIK